MAWLAGCAAHRALPKRGQLTDASGFTNAEEDTDVDSVGPRPACGVPHGTRPRRHRDSADSECGRLNYVIPPASITVWLGRKVTSRPVLHGVLIGTAGSLMYVALTGGAQEPWPYLLAHALKIAGGAAGGLVLAGRPATTQFALRGR